MKKHLDSHLFLVVVLINQESQSMVTFDLMSNEAANNMIRRLNELPPPWPDD
ncbi:MAG TPA: hypothetical protein VH796_13005 [Nitrososphaeraceae archaeon]